VLWLLCRVFFHHCVWFLRRECQFFSRLRFSRYGDRIARWFLDFGKRAFGTRLQSHGTIGRTVFELFHQNAQKVSILHSRREGDLQRFNTLLEERSGHEAIPPFPLDNIGPAQSTRPALGLRARGSDPVSRQCKCAIGSMNLTHCCFRIWFVQSTCSPACDLTARFFAGVGAVWVMAGGLPPPPTPNGAPKNTGVAPAAPLALSLHTARARPPAPPPPR